LLDSGLHAAHVVLQVGDVVVGQRLRAQQRVQLHQATLALGNLRAQFLLRDESVGLHLVLQLAQHLIPHQTSKTSVDDQNRL
jgi:hypothetical protein